MKKLLNYFLVTLVCYLVFMLVLLPVGFVINKLPLPANVQLGQVTGSLWQGKISNALIAGHYVENIQWTLQPWQLLTGKAAAQVKFGQSSNVDGISGQAAVSVSLFGQTVQARNVTLRTPVTEVIKDIRLPLPVVADGRVILTLSEFAQGAPICQRANGNISWTSARVKGLQGWINLNALDGTLSCQQGKLMVTSDANNLLGLDIAAEISGPNQLAVKGFVKPDPSLPKEVHDAMNFIGRPDDQGRYPITM